MSDLVWVALISGCSTGIPACTAAYLAYRTKVISERTEHNTNHLKDELVASVREAAYEAGRLKGQGE